MTLQDELRARGMPAPPPPRRRWDLVAFWIVVVGPVAAIVLWVGWRQRVGDLEERLVRDANATFSAPHPRPVHVGAAEPGTFGDAVLRHLPVIQAEANALKDDAAGRDLARAVVAGARPLSALPERYARVLERLRPDLDGLLRGTRAGRADLPLARESFVPCDGADWTGYQLAALLASVRARRALASGDTLRAASDCLDGLALGRDAAITSGLIGHMAGAAIVRRLAPACAEAIAALGAAERAEALRGVRSIRDAFPSVEETLRVEFLSVELLAYAQVMDAGARARLAPAALPFVREGERRTMPAWERLAARDAWRASRATWDALLRVARSSRGDARDAGFLAVHGATLRRANPLVAMLPVKHYVKYARRADASVSKLDALVALAAAATHRDRTGAWPASIDALAREGLVSASEAERCAGATLVVREGGRGIELRTAVATGDEKAPREDLVLVVTARSGPRGAAR